MKKNRLGFLALTIVIVFSSFQVLARGGDYILGSGDVVRITVFPGDIPDTVSRISEDWMISFPTIGQVKIGGLTERQAESVLRKELERGLIVNSPQVILIVEERVSHQVSVLGNVTSPGKYPIMPGDTIVDLIAQAGGVTDDGSDRVVITRRANENIENFTIDLSTILQKGTVEREIGVEDDDVIYAPPREVFFIYGEVTRPGSYALRRGMTVLQAISIGGGITRQGTERGIKIQREDSKKGILEMEAKLSELLRPNDVVFIKEGLF